ncbi:MULTISPECIES: murein hydrolase activator EnvC [unclassified Phycicoccus]|uniref:murein hydrolase activator EnvC family protein n=1 Tax=unclassified Phycicoccus TaxID=2637926 RepID=UPI0009E72209|nr:MULTISPECIES: peptidoglycan DD-metalloendopeptidase family protein [unclassified Phycicoccus]
MRSALLLPVSTVVAASIGLSLPAPPGLRWPAQPGAGQPAGASVAPGSPSAGAHRVPAETHQAQTGSAAVAVPRSPPSLRGRWGWPLAPRPTVVRPFVPPVSAYGAGHRGIDLAGSTGQEVLAVEAGAVAHVGRIAGRGTVTVLHPSGVRSTYEPVDASVTVGEVVARGSPLGELEAIGSHCRPACLHLGAVRGRAYLDPLVFLTGGRRVRLLPLAQAPDG